MTRFSHARSFDNGVDSWEMADAAPSPALAGAAMRYSWWRESTGSFDTRQELASTGGVFIINLGATLEITDASGGLIRLHAGEGFVGGMAQGTSLSRSTGAMEGIHVFMPINELARTVGVSVANLADRTVTLDQVLGSDAEELGGRLLASGSTDAQFDVLDAFLAKRLSVAAEQNGRMAHIMHRLRRESVSATADALGWSRKRLATWFRDHAGMRPAHFSRLARFERFTGAMQREPHASLAALASDAGYADQAHLTHDVRRLAGTTPGALRARLLPDGGGVRG